MSLYSDLILATSGLVHYYRLGDAASPLVDSKGSENLTAAGTLSFNQPGALFNDADGALDTTGGTNGRGTVGSHTQVAGAGDFTYECWIKFTATTLNVFFLNEGSSASNNQVAALGISTSVAGAIKVLVRNAATTTAGGAGGFETTSTWNDGLWHYVALVGIRSTNVLNLYVDDTSTPAATNSTYPTGTYGMDEFGVGCLFRIAAASNLKCVLDEVAVYNVALSTATLTAHRNAGRTDNDTGTAVEVEAIASTLSDADTGSGADTESVAPAVSSADTGAGVDAGESVASTLTDTETGAAVEVGAIATTFSDGDTASAVETEDVLSFAPQADGDTGTGSDTESVAPAVADNDPGTADDAQAITVNVLDGESGTGVDSGSEVDHPILIPLTLTYRLLDNPAGIRASRVHVTFTTDYTVGGEILLAESVGLPDIHFAIPLPLGFGYEVQWVAGKLMVFQAGVEVAAHTDLSSLVVEVIAYFTG